MVDVAQLVESRIVIPVVVGSSPIVHPIFRPVHRNEQVRYGAKQRIGLLAQLVEQWTLNPLVQGSNP